MVSGRQRYHRAGGLGHAVALGKSAAKNRNRSTQQRFADRRCAVHQQLQATDVDRVDLGGVEQHLDDSRHEEGVGAPVLGDRPHNRGGFDLAHQHGMSTKTKRRHAVTDAADVKERHRKQVHA